MQENITLTDEFKQDLNSGSAHGLELKWARGLAHKLGLESATIGGIEFARFLQILIYSDAYKKIEWLTENLPADEAKEKAWNIILDAAKIANNCGDYRVFSQMVRKEAFPVYIFGSKYSEFAQKWLERE